MWQRWEGPPIEHPNTLGSASRTVLIVVISFGRDDGGYSDLAARGTPGLRLRQPSRHNYSRRSSTACGEVAERLRVRLQ
jgi:hypothetical protein